MRHEQWFGKGAFLFLWLKSETSSVTCVAVSVWCILSNSPLWKNMMIWWMEPKRYLDSINQFKRECVLVGFKGSLFLLPFALKLKKYVNYWIALSDCPDRFSKESSMCLPQWIMLRDPCQQYSYKNLFIFFCIFVLPGIIFILIYLY